MAIAYLCRQDYAAGGYGRNGICRWAAWGFWNLILLSFGFVSSFKMLSMQDESGKRTALAALRNCAYLAPLGFLAYECNPWLFSWHAVTMRNNHRSNEFSFSMCVGGLTTEWFAVETALLSAGMGTVAAMFYHKPGSDRARKLFRASLVYLPLLLAGMLIHRRPNEHPNKASLENLANEDLTTGHIFEVIQEEKMPSRRKPSQPPAASFSVAPFPFLPVPDFRSS